MWGRLILFSFIQAMACLIQLLSPLLSPLDRGAQSSQQLGMGWGVGRLSKALYVNNPSALTDTALKLPSHDRPASRLSG